MCLEFHGWTKEGMNGYGFESSSQYGAVARKTKDTTATVHKLSMPRENCTQS